LTITSPVSLSLSTSSLGMRWLLVAHTSVAVCLRGLGAVP
jgi:hypothetical protein